MSNSNLIRHIYVRDAHDRPIGCIAVRVMRSKNRAEYGLVMRHPKDSVDERHRMIKLDRMLTQQLAEGDLDNAAKPTYISGEADFHEVTAAVLGDIIAKREAPTRAIKFAKRWLNDTHDSGNQCSSLVSKKLEHPYPIGTPVFTNFHGDKHFGTVVGYGPYNGPYDGLYTIEEDFTGNTIDIHNIFVEAK